jgi:hypothetical protein
MGCLTLLLMCVRFLRISVSAELMFAGACGACLENVCGETGCSASGRTRALSGCKGILLDYSFHVILKTV